MPDALPDFDNFIEIVKSLMLDCGARALFHYQNIGEVTSKTDNSPLTAADLEIDAQIYEVLKGKFPDLDIVTEERASTHIDRSVDRPFLLVDPIDGTREFINQRDEFTINIGLIIQGKPVFGAVCVPAKATMFIGYADNGAWEHDCNFEKLTLGPPVQISPAMADNNSLRTVASRSHQDEKTKEFIATNNVGEIITAGSSLKFCILAAGKADIYPRFGPTMEWDTAAGHAILLAAGGQVNGPDGKPLHYGKPQFRNGAFIANTPGVAYQI